MYLIVYTSTYSGHKNDFKSDVRKIVEEAKVHNAKSDICGVLIINDGRFLQILEGEQEDLSSLMGKIQKDNRHKNVDILVDQSVETRSFDDWNMEVFDLSDKTSLNNESLKIITDIYKENFSLNGKVLAGFYKEMTKNISELTSLN